MCNTNEDSLKHLRSSLAYLDKFNPISGASTNSYLFGADVAGAAVAASSGPGGSQQQQQQQQLHLHNHCATRLSHMRASIGNINLLTSSASSGGSAAGQQVACAPLQQQPLPLHQHQHQHQYLQQQTAMSGVRPTVGACRSYFRKVTSTSAQMAPRKRQQTSSVSCSRQISIYCSALEGEGEREGGRVLQRIIILSLRYYFSEFTFECAPGAFLIRCVHLSSGARTTPAALRALLFRAPIARSSAVYNLGATTCGRFVCREQFARVRRKCGVPFERLERVAARQSPAALLAFVPSSRQSLASPEDRWQQIGSLRYGSLALTWLPYGAARSEQRGDWGAEQFELRSARASTRISAEEMSYLMKLREIKLSCLN